MRYHIPKKDLQHGKYYHGSCRNATIARWNAKTQLFYHWRYKFGRAFIETIKCPEDDTRYDVFYATDELNATPDKEIEFHDTDGV